ncbi:aromatic hydrocarbon degradation protein [Chlorobium phaeovibrioides]|uniref:Aromatic hydrocarbon degradation protein n=1 Tax=Chlorobium phaeovibrioides TaxID=1094 RepID=A0A432AUE4_CHLPH|nr:outer membrane protein transport protein [Chlorobium phaeovibrioides]RTY38147.1 aromatic hydrocarbon degradation protein [Chlorobium phaeovibrioides]
MLRKTLSGAVIALSLTGASTALATNGMNLEGYGAKSHAMGGTGMAYDTGNSAVMNNPATLGMMKEGTEEIGIGIRGLHPEVQSDYGAMSDHSSATAFYMPSLSYIRKDGDITWGAALLSQGGMGTDYGNDSPLFQGGYDDEEVRTMLSGKDIRSEVGVGRLMFPISYNLTDNTTIGASADFVWASMDLQMDMDGMHFGMMETGGSMLPTVMADTLDYVRYDFSNGTPFIGKAVGYGTGFKLGFTHKVSKLLTIGGTYHSQTMMSDLESSNAKLTVVNTAGTQDVSGKIKVNDFEWPATFAAGLALRPTDKLMVAADVKFVDWSTVMDKFSTSFIADNTADNGDYAGETLDMSMKQDWKDQTVYSVGVEYKATDRLALRGGASFSTNPVPDEYLHPLFPAIIKNHYTCGFGYRLTDDARMGMAYSWAPKVTETNGEGMVISHSQSNWSLNFVHNL